VSAPSELRTQPATDRSPDATVRPQRSRWYWAARDTWTVTRRNLHHFVRQPRLLIFSTVQPVMFVLLFSFVFGGIADTALPDGLSYIDWLLPGIFVQSAVFRTTQTAVGLAEDLERGVIDRFRSLPMARLAVLAGRTGADLVRSVAIVFLMIAVGYAIGFRFTEGPIAALGAVLVVAVFGYALSWVFVYVAMAVPGAEAAQSAGFVAVFPLVFASSIFVPIETMPGWLQAFAAYSPVTAAADAARALSVGGAVARPLLLTGIWVVVFCAVAIPVSTRRFQRMT
jgi:ABC transporter DrrB family efflux protein